MRLAIRSCSKNFKEEITPGSNLELYSLGADRQCLVGSGGVWLGKAGADNSGKA